MFITLIGLSANIPLEMILFPVTILFSTPSINVKTLAGFQRQNLDQHYVGRGNRFFKNIDQGIYINYFFLGFQIQDSCRLIKGNHWVHFALRLYAMKVMTSFGYEIMLPRGFWFQTLDVNKPWRQIPSDRLHFFFFLVFTNFSFWLPQGNTKRRNLVQIKPRYWKKFWTCQ